MRHEGVIVVVEDSDEDFDVLAQAFARFGIKNALLRCCDGEVALDLLTRGTAGPPCLVLLDLNLPGGNGAELLVKMRRLPRLRGLPVIVWSTSCNPRDVAFCYDNGANCYAAKPVGLEKLERFVVLFRDFWLDTIELPPPDMRDVRPDSID